MFNSQKDFHKKLLGKVGENLATNYLKEHGYQIIDRNYKTHIGEIDIIAKKDDFIIFVEVKTRSNNNFGLPCQAVDCKKQHKYFLLAKEYMQKYKEDNVNIRFDIIEVENNQINHIENAFSM